MKKIKLNRILNFRIRTRMENAENTITGTLDKYTLTKTLGSGFSAKVKLAHDDSGKEYAIKIFDLNNEMNDKRQMELIK